VKSQIKLYKDDVPDFYEWAQKEKLELNTQSVDWRVLMFKRPGQKQWSQVYDGRTNSGKNERDYLRVFGPDSDLIADFYRRK
jgi:hypothetical protein